MDFLLNEEQEILKDSIRKFAEKEIRPLIKESDEKGEWPEILTQKFPDKPVISHEIGQWCVYPNLKEMKKYLWKKLVKNAAFL